MNTQIFQLKCYIKLEDGCIKIPKFDKCVEHITNCLLEHRDIQLHDIMGLVEEKIITPEFLVRDSSFEGDTSLHMLPEADISNHENSQLRIEHCNASNKTFEQQADFITKKLSQEDSETTHEITNFENSTHHLDDMLQCEQPLADSSLLTVPEPRCSAPELGDIGESIIFNHLQSLFPKLELRLVSATSHVADIHLIDENTNTCFVFEVKNKTALTRDDLSKFDSDLENIRTRQLYTNMSIVGVFVSLRAPIPRYGDCFISNDVCYLSQNFLSDECLYMVIDMYRNIVRKLKPKTEKKTIAYQIPENVYTLIARLRSEYSSLNTSREYYMKQIEINRQSSGMMQELLCKTDIQLQFIDFINREFSDVIDVVNVQSDDETRLREYLQTNKRVLKKDLISMFPSMTILRNMKLDEIKSRFGMQ